MIDIIKSELPIECKAIMALKEIREKIREQERKTQRPVFDDTDNWMITGNLSCVIGVLVCGHPGRRWYRIATGPLEVCGHCGEQLQGYEANRAD